MTSRARRSKTRLPRRGAGQERIMTGRYTRQGCEERSWMNEYSFEGRVAGVTRAGGGIGGASARLLADRGAGVVINDLGGSMEGVEADPEPASAVAAEIV